MYENNNNIDRDEEQLKPLLEAIRESGSPYVSPEPDQLYWANFRVRVMEQVEAKQNRSWLVSIKEWFSPVRAGLVGLAGSAAVALALLMNPSEAPVQKPIASQNGPVNSEPSPSQVSTPKENGSAVAPKENTNYTEAPQVTPKDESSPTEIASNQPAVAPKESEPVKEPAQIDASVEAIDAEAAIAVLDASEKLPVSLDELSETELETLLDGLKADYN